NSFDIDFFKTTILNEIESSDLINKINCRVRFILYRNATGFYLPNSNETAFIIESFDLPENWKEIAAKTKKTGIYTFQTKAIGTISNLKTGNALIYVLAKIWASENGLDDALILNQNGNIIEASSSNIFWKKNNQIYTVPLAEGCIAGVARQVYIEQMEVENKPIIEKKCLEIDLREADEIFITNAANGICNIELV
ncbi:MAG: aminotransferase class IV, partial [Bacteroidia bacterium]|nr:aminotransferase class IV [Bacteroidia bacterium]